MIELLIVDRHEQAFDTSKPNPVIWGAYPITMDSSEMRLCLHSTINEEQTDEEDSAVPEEAPPLEPIQAGLRTPIVQHISSNEEQELSASPSSTDNALPSHYYIDIKVRT